MTTTMNAFCQELAQQIPDIAEILSKHVNDYDELLPHVFMGDVTRYVSNDGSHRTDVVQALEKAFANEGPEVEELIAVSFVENLETQEELKKALSGVDAPRLVAEWKRQHSR